MLEADHVNDKESWFWKDFPYLTCDPESYVLIANGRERLNYGEI
jgi:hypothetical protein